MTQLGGLIGGFYSPLLWMDNIMHHRSESLVSDDFPVNTDKQWLQPWFHFVVRNGFRPLRARLRLLGTSPPQIGLKERPGSEGVPFDRFFFGSV